MQMEKSKKGIRSQQLRLRESQQLRLKFGTAKLNWWIQKHKAAEGSQERQAELVASEAIKAPRISPFQARSKRKPQVRDTEREG
jgi:hypothetical protein